MTADGRWSKPRGAIPGISATERDLLLALRVAPRSSVKDLAAAISLSEAGVRGPLARLEAAGLITHELAGEGPGRRRHAYVLTSVALSLFPGGYEDFWREMARFLRDRYPEAWAAFWEEDRVTIFPQRLEPQPPEKALQSLKSFYESRDFIVATNFEAADGPASLTLFHCPYLGIAVETPMLCELERRALAKAVPGSTVERVAHQLEGHPHCRYLVRFPAGMQRPRG